MNNEQSLRNLVSVSAEIAELAWPGNPENVQRVTDSEKRWAQDLPAAIAAAGQLASTDLWFGRTSILVANFARAEKAPARLGVSRPKELLVFKAWRSSSLSRALTAKFVEAHPDQTQAYVSARESLVEVQLDSQGTSESTRSAILAPITHFAALEGAGWLDLRARFSPWTRLYTGGIEDRDEAEGRWASNEIREVTFWTPSLRSAIGVYVADVSRILGRPSAKRLPDAIADGITVILVHLLPQIPTTSLLKLECNRINSGDAACWLRLIGSAFTVPKFIRSLEHLKPDDLADLIAARRRVGRWAQKYATKVWGPDIDAQFANHQMDTLINDLASVGTSGDERLAADKLLAEWRGLILDSTVERRLRDGESVKTVLNLDSRRSVVGPAIADVDPVGERNPETEESGADQSAVVDQSSERSHGSRAGAVEQTLAKIDALVGMQEFKDHVGAVMALHQVNERRRGEGLPVQPVSHHAVLTGNPGTGKTTAARLLAELYNNLGILAEGHLREVGREDLVAKYVGQTAARTQNAVESAIGGVLFLDEAYSLASDSERDFGSEAIEVLVREMENRRDEWILLAAGYRAEMTKFLDANPGLRSRFGFSVSFPDMSEEQLFEVAANFLAENGLDVTQEGNEALKEAVANLDRGAGFANARSVRSLVESVRVKQALRLASDPEASLTEIRPEDISAIESSGRGGSVDPNELHEALLELNALVGLESVKASIQDLVALARADRLRREKGLPGDSVVGHFVFTGHPGTGKTTVARLLGRILRALGMLSSGHTVEVGRADLVGRYVGQTAPKTTDAVERADGGVLFIDEAYSLAAGDERGGDFGKEAVTTLVQMMENRRGRFVCVFAGYEDEMNRLLSVNEGLKSRISHRIAFENYTTDQLLVVIERTALSRGRTTTSEFLDGCRPVLDELRVGSDFGNARTARALLDESITSQARRLGALQSIRVSPEDLQLLKKEDVPSLRAVAEKEEAKVPFGFLGSD